MKVSNMEARSVFVVLWFLSAVLGVVPAKDAYFGLGGKLVLDPRVSFAIANIAWKLDNNLVADWEKGGTITYFGPFKDRTDLDTNTGVLTLTRATAEDQGVFTVEINDRVQDLSYSAKMIEAVPAPEVGISPLSCDAHSESCTAKCDVKGRGPTERSEPITYSWKMDDGDWVKGPKEREITKDEVKYVKEFFCRMQNQIDHKDSEAKENPLYEPPPPPKPKPYWIIAVVISILLLAGGGGFGLWYTKPEFFTWLPSCRQADTAKDSTSPDAADPTNTVVLLKETRNDQGNGPEAP